MQKKIKKYLKNKASFFIPPNIEELIIKFGNKGLYNTQYKSNFSTALHLNSDIERLISLFHKYKKCLEQEVLIEVVACSFIYDRIKIGSLP